jgi:hypothetical protein
MSNSVHSIRRQKFSRLQRIILQRPAVLALLETYESHIDDFIPPEVTKFSVIQYIESCRVDRYKLPKFARHVVDMAGWKYSSADCALALENLLKKSICHSHGRGGYSKIGSKTTVKAPKYPLLLR